MRGDIRLGDGTPATPTPSATVVVLRDGNAGPEVFMLRRHALSDVLGDAYVFPGGKVDASDFGLEAKLDGPPAQLQAALAEPGLDEALAAALYVAAIRELFEEAGVLTTSGGIVERNGRAFDAAVAHEETRLAVSRLAPWSRWITPRASFRARKHFDARFFVALLPEGENPLHDEHETTDSVWITPRGALQAYWDGHIDLPPPQLMTLTHLARHASCASVLHEARSRPPLLVQPEVFDREGTQIVCYPGDPLHSVAARALPGPSRLQWAGKRYEPEGGLEAFFR